MELESYEDTISQAKASLNIEDTEFSQLSTTLAEIIIRKIEDKFMDGHHWVWWWEHLQHVDFAAIHRNDEGYLWLHQILPEPEEQVWFIVEPFGEERQFSVYQSLAKHIQPILEESICFEYYVAEKNLNWLMGENHHGCFFFVGDQVASRIQRIVENHPEQWASAN